MVDIDNMKSQSMKNYKDILDNYKKNLNKRVDQLKQEIENKLIVFVEYLAVGAVISYGFVKYFDIDVKKGIESISNAIDTFRRFKSRHYDTIDNISRFLTGDVTYINNMIYEGTKSFPQHIENIVNFFSEQLDTFFNSPTGDSYTNVFSEILHLTAAFAFNRIFESSFGGILGLFFDKLHLDVIKRPDLTSFLKFGPQVFAEISQTEHMARQLAQLSQISEVKMTATQYASLYEGSNSDDVLSDVAYEEHHGWFWRKGNEYKTVDSGDGSDEKRGWLRTMNDLHVAFVGVASAVSDKTNLDNPFNDVISPYSTDEYKKASEKLKAALDTDFDLKNKWFFDGKLRDFRFIGQDYDEAIKKIDELKNEFRADANPEIRKIITRWENIKSRLDMGRYTEDRGITVEVANEIVLILMSLNMFRKQQLINNMTHQELEYQSFLKETKATRALNVLKQITESEIDYVQDDILSGRLTLKQMVTIYKNFFADVDIDLKEKEQAINEEPYDPKKGLQPYTKSKEGRLFSKLMLRDVFDERISVYHSANKIKSIKNEILKLKYNQMGYSNVYFFNTYSKGSNDSRNMTVVGAESVRDREQKDVTDNDISSNMANIELATRLLQEFNELKKITLIQRKRRSELINNLVQDIDNLVKIKEKYPKVK